MKKTALVIFLVLLIGILAACGGTEKSQRSIENNKTKGSLKAEDYDKLYSDPKQYKGYEIELTGQIFTEPEKDDRGTYFQMWADPEQLEKNTVVKVMDLNLNVKSGQYVKIKGVVGDEFEGENAFGATIIAPIIIAESVEKVDYITAVAPTIKKIEVEQEINQHDIIVTLQKVEIAENQTRVYIKVQNMSDDMASFYSFSTKLVVGNKQYEQEYIDSEATGLEEPQSELLPKIETEGVIIYPPIDPNEEVLNLYAETNSNNYNLVFEPYVFEVDMRD